MNGNDLKIIGYVGCNLKFNLKLRCQEAGGNGVMDIALGCCAGGPGSIPTVGLAESSCNIQVIFLTLWSKVVGK